jgi:hypothetical protein
MKEKKNAALFVEAPFRAAVLSCQLKTNAKRAARLKPASTKAFPRRTFFIIQNS